MEPMEPMEPKYKQGDGVIVTNVGVGVICSNPEYEYDDEEQTSGDWTYLVSFNEINDNGWFGEKEMEDYTNTHRGAGMKKRFIVEIEYADNGIEVSNKIIRPVSYEPSMSDQYDSDLVTEVVKEMKDAFEYGDLEAVDELLRFIPRTNLVQYLPEEEWEKWMTPEELKDIYEGRSKQ